MNSVLFLCGSLTEENDSVVSALHGHLPYINREPNPNIGEEPMTLVRDGEVIARGHDAIVTKVSELRDNRLQERAASVR